MYVKMYFQHILMVVITMESAIGMEGTRMNSHVVVNQVSGMIIRSQLFEINEIISYSIGLASITRCLIG